MLFRSSEDINTAHHRPSRVQTAWHNHPTPPDLVRIRQGYRVNVLKNLNGKSVTFFSIRTKGSIFDKFSELKGTPERTWIMKMRIWGHSKPQSLARVLRGTGWSQSSRGTTQGHPLSAQIPYLRFFLPCPPRRSPQPKQKKTAVGNLGIPR